MGRGIARAIAAAGIAVTVRELNADLAHRAIEAIRRSLARAVEKEKITPDQMQSTLANIATTDDLKEAAGSGIVIEAIVEDVEKKKDVFAALDAICSPQTILATNTSALSIENIASACKRPERVLGLHFFNPVPAMKLVEIIKGHHTTAEAVSQVRAFADRIGKTAIEVNESPGFVVNRLLIPMINEAAYASMEGVAAREDIDTAMKLGAAHPMGPLALGDLIGLDIVVQILEIMADAFNNPKYVPCPLLKELVKKGSLGRKTGRGFFEYEAA